jgi:hypothetical protein
MGFDGLLPPTEFYAVLLSELGYPMSIYEMRELGKLEYGDPHNFLVKLRNFESEIAASNLDSKVKRMRTNSLKKMRELREAAMFCYLMGERLNCEVLLSPTELQDYDFVARYICDETCHFTKVQLKELPPADLNDTLELQSILRNVEKKYNNAADLCIAVHLNRTAQIDLSAVDVTRINVGGIWMFGALDLDQSKFGLWGDFKRELIFSEHSYPTTLK